MNLANEHEYIKELIVARWWSEVERLVHPLQDKARQHLLSAQSQQFLDLDAKVAQLGQQLMGERETAEDRLRWLKLDSELRLDGKNYPDVYENVKQTQRTKLF